MSTEPGSAALCSRAATFVVSPIAVYSVLISSPTTASTASPVLIPTRTAKSTPYSSLTTFAYSRAAAWISKPARTARSASSSCAIGAPKNARIASPSNLAIVPSYLVTEALRKANAPFMISATCSGSSRSPSPVESTASAKSTVTYLRSPSTRTWASSRLPQFRQNFAPSGLTVSQLGQLLSNTQLSSVDALIIAYILRAIQPVWLWRYSGTLLKYWCMNCTAIESSLPLIYEEQGDRHLPSQKCKVARSCAASTSPPNATSASATSAFGSTNWLERRRVRTSRRTPAARAASPASVAVECPMVCARSEALFGP